VSRTLPTEGEPLPELCSNTVRDVTDLQRSLACSEPGSCTATLAVLTPTPDTASPPSPHHKAGCHVLMTVSQLAEEKDDVMIEMAAENGFFCRLGLSQPSVAGGPWTDFMVSVNLSGEKVRTLFSLASNLIARDSVMNGGQQNNLWPVEAKNI